ncbi:hypothetical protein CAT723_23010 [Corynebacterium ammoniagenes]|uniref:Transposase n=1 Tax=Corynebacterium ammoniagenes TaxID=1697 RepID=A0AAV5GAJ8_CORAM|nr:hypothetical protein CAT723_23010 [Corynebacterium ammoniagenes]
MQSDAVGVDEFMLKVAFELNHGRRQGLGRQIGSLTVVSGSREAAALVVAKNPPAAKKRCDGRIGQAGSSI